MNLKINKTSNAMSINCLLITEKCNDGLNFFKYMTKNWYLYKCKLIKIPKHKQNYN